MTDQRHYAWVKKVPRSFIEFYWFLRLIKDQGIKELKKEHNHFKDIPSDKFEIETYQEGYDFMLDWITVRVIIDTQNV